MLESDRVFGAVGAGLAVPLASRLALTGDLRGASIVARDRGDAARTTVPPTTTLEGRLGVMIDF